MVPFLADQCLREIDKKPDIKIFVARKALNEAKTQMIFGYSRHNGKIEFAASRKNQRLGLP